MQQDRFVKIGVFYDGNYFHHVSSYYNFAHERSSHISIDGLHDFIRREVATFEGSDERLCQIVDAHYFRGRLNAYEASERPNILFNDRVFDDVLMSQGVTTHYLPIRNVGGVKQEKGIDVWLALEAFELAFYKRFDVLVLIACDGDYVPLVRKLNTLGSRVMVLSWDFEYTTEEGKKMSTRTSQDLLEEVTYPISMHEVIDNRVRRNDPMVNNLFVKTNVNHKANTILQNRQRTQSSDSEYLYSSILNINNGFGFIKFPPSNLFFHYNSLVDSDFHALKIGTKVAFKIGKNDRNEDIAIEVKVTK